MAALEACAAQLLADCKSMAMEASQKSLDAACYWEQYMPPAWKQARAALAKENHHE